jgi:hypothetical protein
VFFHCFLNSAYPVASVVVVVAGVVVVVAVVVVAVAVAVRRSARNVL